MLTENITALMDRGYPVGVKFTQIAPVSQTDRLFCELVQQARHGETISFSAQGCPVGAYVLGRDAPRPTDYYLSSGRYISKVAAAQAAGSLPCLDTRYNFVELFPVKQDQVDFDVLLLFLSPARAMRLVRPCLIITASLWYSVTVVRPPYAGNAQLHHSIPNACAFPLVAKVRESTAGTQKMKW